MVLFGRVKVVTGVDPEPLGVVAFAMSFSVVVRI
jgi:hypothetical protein